MSLHIFLLEIRMMVRERAAWLLVALFAGALGYGLWNGSQLAKRNSEATTAAAENSEKFLLKVRQHLSRPGQSLPVRNIAGYGSLALLPPAPLPGLATG